MSTKEKFQRPCNAYSEIFTDKPTQGYKYQYLSPFEFKNILITRAEAAVKNPKKKFANQVLNAGRGNPNFFSTTPRLMHSILNIGSTLIGNNLTPIDNMGMTPTKKGLWNKLNNYLAVFDTSESNSTKSKSKSKSKSGANIEDNACGALRTCLTDMYQTVLSSKGENPKYSRDDFALDVVVSSIGCFYPSPPRVQDFVEPVLSKYLKEVVYRSDPNATIDVMPTEGAAAAILYVLNSLKYNDLVVAGDRIAVFTPIFSPYLELPGLENYKLVQVCIEADGDNNWEIPMDQIEKLQDPKIKAMFLVNPTNPTSRSLSATSVQMIKGVLTVHNPDIIILEDNVYAPFCTEFNDFFNVMPKNTIGVFSFSKYFGTTGCRLGTIAMHTSTRSSSTNIIDGKLLKQQSKEVSSRYNMLSDKVSSIKFIDRILADSRQVAEAHVAGLSTPQQTLMALMASFDGLDTKRNYQQSIATILRERITLLCKDLNHTLNETSVDTNYYIVLDITKVAVDLFHEPGFAEYLKCHQDPLEFLMTLASEYGTVLLPGVGFAAPFWSVRVSLANLDTPCYEIIGANIKSLLEHYCKKYDKWVVKNNKMKLAKATK